ncbi:MAG: response regulator transcription factor [Opitutaceae bacterium]|nr:response regulator transcription factor [Opitutaceae bacterium]
MTSAMPTPALRAPASTRRVRLLVADDSLLARQAVLTYLRTLEHVEIITVCENGRLAVEAALRQEPDVVLLDLQMPVMSGLEAAEIFRNSMPQVGVILTSVHDHAEVREACLAGGADAFVGKGSIPDRFPSLLAAVLEMMRAPSRHRRAPHFVTRPLVDLFSPALPHPRAGVHTPARTPGRGRAASGLALG